MTEAILPNKSRTKKDPVLFADSYENDVALKTVIEGQLDNANLSGSAGIKRSQLEAAARGVAGTWYTPKAIATEQTRESATFGKLTTADEIAEVVVPENGLLKITYTAQVKSSVSGAGRVAVFVGANQMGSEASLLETSFNRVATEPAGLSRALATATVTTGRVLQSLQIGELAAGTYAVSVQYRATSGSVTAKERNLKAEVRGY